jgi:hypothetical protein
MALVIVGIPQSRAFRTIWMCNELGIDYTLRTVSHKQG